MSIQKQSFVVYFFMTILILSGCTLSKVDITQEQTTVDENLLLTLPSEPISYFNSVKPLLERRCISCHGCYDAQCQLKLTSIEGIQRGANKDKVYDGTRMFGVNPTRLMIDAKTTAQWRKKNFHTVLNEGENTPRKNLQESTLYKFLRLKQRHPQARIGMLSNDFDLSLDRKQTCPTSDEFQSYAQKHPKEGMPYAMPNLNHQEYTTLVQWIAQGSPVDSKPVASKQTTKQIAQWEQFFNKRSSNKEKLMNRYLYEHLFQAHIHFTDAPPREFFRLVRSRTAPGQEIDEIASTHPYDDPGVASFYYRLRPYHASIVAKNHVVYELSPQKMDRYRELFLKPDYKVENLPSYDPGITANPFKVYQSIPAKLRYRFLLDDARFFIEGFIKGPVCRGQVALNVIEDNFWVFFHNPDLDSITDDADFLAAISNDLDIPAGDTLNILAASTTYKKKVERYWEALRENFTNISGQADVKQALAASIWDGGGTNPNAALTIYRHSDSASVHFGLTGRPPETAWVINYPLLERIHYLLVAGFDVYGNVGHQLNTRVYMDFLRTEGENNFLMYLPASKRRAIRDSWYLGIREGQNKKLDDSSGWLDKEIVIGYQTDDPQAELYQHLQQRLGKMTGPIDLLNRCKSQSCIAAAYNTAPSAEQKADMALAKVADINGAILQVFPDLAFVRIRDAEQQAEFAYTLIRNKSYKNVSSMLTTVSYNDSDVDNDTLTVMKGLHGSYPNFFFDIQLQQVDDFAERYAAISSRKDYEQFVSIYGVRRTRTEFWAITDWFQDYYAKQEPVLSGVFDLSRYNNR